MSEVKRYQADWHGMFLDLPGRRMGTEERLVVLASDFDRVTGERDALQQRLTAADEQIDLLTPRHTEQPEGKRERFEKWVMATKHPVYGFLDGRSLARGDDRTGYADEYVQGLWVAYLAFGVEQPAPVAVDVLSTGFYTTESGGGKYALNIGFRSMADMQAADAQLRELLKFR